MPQKTLVTRAWIFLVHCKILTKDVFTESDYAALFSSFVQFWHFCIAHTLTEIFEIFGISVLQPAAFPKQCRLKKSCQLPLRFAPGQDF